MPTIRAKAAVSRYGQAQFARRFATSGDGCYPSCHCRVLLVIVTAIATFVVTSTDQYLWYASIVVTLVTIRTAYASQSNRDSFRNVCTK
jgi:hypothetical protein